MVDTNQIYAKCKCGIIHFLAIPKSFLDEFYVLCCGSKLEDMEIIEKYPGILYDVKKSLRVYRKRNG